MGKRTRIRWVNVARLAAGAIGCTALVVGLPALLDRPKPPPLPSDVGLAPAADAPPAPRVKAPPRSDKPRDHVKKHQGSGRRSAPERDHHPQLRRSARRDPDRPDRDEAPRQPRPAPVAAPAPPPSSATAPQPQPAPAPAPAPAYAPPPPAPVATSSPPPSPNSSSGGGTAPSSGTPEFGFEH
jgi:hypothetical protein